ncbi:hypothetical protein HAX54_009489 [Datura stramonium]|uniref:Uncharacterized protein n=1 Tax=Datura stramonium TaxID=4076 RepID=A0ABS8TG78_DATST|nr:hypothetical protein [Datura stramonium]
MVDKLGSLCARVDVPEDEVVAFREEIDRRREIILPIACLAVQREIEDSEQPHDEVLPIMDASNQGDPYWVPSIYSYHEARTLPNRWVVSTLHSPLALLPDTLMSSVTDITSRHFS